MARFRLMTNGRRLVTLGVVVREPSVNGGLGIIRWRQKAQSLH